MTVSSAVRRVSYDGDGVTNVFPIPFYFLDNTHLLFTQRSAAGVETNPSTSSITGALNPAGGSASLTVVLAVGEKLVITGNAPLTQGLALPETGLFSSKTAEQELDKLTMICQQLNEKLARTISFPITSSAALPSIADPVEGALLGWAGGNIVSITPLSVNYFTAFYQDGSGNISVGRPGSVYSGKLDVNGTLWVQSRASINCSGDATGTDSVNTYGQYDAYQPFSGMGAPGAVGVPGLSASTSRGTGLVPVISQSSDLIGGVSAYAYSGASPAYNCHAGIYARVTGATTNNLGGALEFWVKADGGALALAATMTNAGIMNFVNTPTVGGVSMATTIDNSIQDFRLTLTTGTPVTTADVTGATKIYCTPYKGTRIALYNGSTWNIRTSAEFSLALGTLTSGKPYDVFCYDNAGVPTLEFLVWTNDTTRATALVYQDGVLVKSGATTRRYMGTFYTTATTTTEDSASSRYLWNYSNRVRRRLFRQDSSVASWNYTLATFRQANNSTLNQLNVIVGVSEDVIDTFCSCPVTNATAGVDVTIGIGFDAITSPADCLKNSFRTQSANNNYGPNASYSTVPTAGRHYFTWLEASTPAGTTTWNAFNGNFTAGIYGTMMA